jgi:hypothetical protein
MTTKGANAMKKIVVALGAAILLASVVVAGALTSLGSAGTPAIKSTSLVATTSRHDDRSFERREHGRRARDDARGQKRDRAEHAQPSHGDRHGLSHGDD